jgi:16S rRNA pseudouridine516 synthase
MPKLRLDKFLRDQGIASRSDIKELVRKGLVLINDNAVRDPGAYVVTECDTVKVNGEKICYREYVYYMLNKPKGIITATEDRDAKTVLDLFPENLRRRGIFPAGRLDKDTEGLLIITDNGAFAHDLISPKKHVTKLYEAVLDIYPGEWAIRAFKEGVDIGGYVALPAELSFISESSPVIARVEIYEGKFHQVKRMFKAAGAEVLELKRLRIGDVWLDESLKPGEYRELTDEEVAILMNLSF